MVVRGGITAQNIHFQIGDFTIRDLSLEVKPGEYFVLTGPNGAGKTVLIRLIAGLFRPSSGIISIGGQELTDLPPWARDVGYVPQDGVLFPNMTVRENVRFGLDMRGVKKQRKKERVLNMARSLNIERLLDRTVEGLSGGEKQKASLARALVVRPSVLLLDEPVSAVDEETRDDLCCRLRQIHEERDMTTLHVSHNRRETRLVADRMAALRDGVVERVGTPRSILGGAAPETADTLA